VIAQVTVIPLEMPCEPIYADETAWASGDQSFRTGWGSWFEYEVCQP